ncbi:putative sulfate/thiosulfate transporter subunit: ATP-binding component of ABC superfamily transporter [Alteromonas sp. 38]|uniref:ATP-binding cassette domain-containing protein n=1 Tax=Alteromonas TaxID=226 RepID=UPI0012EF14FE|nr:MULTISPECIES: ATP-binding cassette domain-containing protein [Alteromonas]CAD5272597.1 putative sulfate/thiosulfate transporter subunit: ATP-binding component of ABC superfamily transporter [Alteromonas sp. 154]VXB52901.1 putative sulfate/thiosulfate transporter subunit: ATP-binding component of ABC superfamily transporter [Alteromonas sp. 38]
MTLKLDKVSLFRYTDTLFSLDEEINPGEVLSIMGPSGSGKSTLLNAIAGQLTAPFSMKGSIYINDKCINGMPAHNRGVGVLYQDPLLFEHMTVGQNIAFALPSNMLDKASIHNAPSKKTLSRAQRDQRVTEMLAEVGLESLQHRPVQTLSGGQQARIALLRTLAAAPNVVLLDEPFSKLDAATKTQMRTWVFSQLKARGLPTLLVTHDSEDVEAAQGRLIEIETC